MLLPVVISAVLLATAPPAPGGGWAARGAATPLDSAREEMGVGRHWHAARILRGAGVHRSDDPEALLLLARAEAGWRNWPEVARLLEGRAWIGEREGGAGWCLLARAHEEAKAWAPASEAYRSCLGSRGGSVPEEAALRARFARAALAAGDVAGAAGALDAIPGALQAVRGWAGVEAGEALAAEGDTAGVRTVLARVQDPGALEAAWSLTARARLRAADSAGALAGYLAVRDGRPGGRRVEAATEAGLLALALGDTSAARPLLSQGLGEEGPLRSRARAASALLALGPEDPTATLELADVLDRAGDAGLALRAYDRAARLVGGGAALNERQRLARARLLATVPARHAEALEEFRAIREGTQDPAIGARNLELWTALRRRQGRTAEVATLQRWLLAEHPSSTQAAEILWSRGSAAEGRGEAGAALEAYRAVAAANPTGVRAGQARMRMGQILLGGGRVEEAARVWEAYLSDFPSGRRWDEASFWAARARLSLGDTAAARALVDRIRAQDPVSYYAVMGADLLDLSFDVAVPDRPGGAPPPWLGGGLELLRILQDAGLDDGAEAVERELVARARPDAEALLALAEGLIGMDRTVAGINLGWDLRRDGAPWDRRLLRVVFPFPHRELVEREAEEWGLDPILMAALIRQESAFKADIRSHAGAVGLMQVMPPTGRELAARHGPEGFREANLESAEVNLHLGAAFLRDMSRRYDDLTLVLSAYNAGPTRATRWRGFPEAADPLRFTERIPFEETRGYVKNVRRNLGLYRALYAAQ